MTNNSDMRRQRAAQKAAQLAAEAEQLAARAERLRAFATSKPRPTRPTPASSDREPTEREEQRRPAITSRPVGSLPAQELASRELQRAQELEAQAREARERAVQAARHVPLKVPEFATLPPHARAGAQLRWELSALYGAAVPPEFGLSDFVRQTAHTTELAEPQLPEAERIRRRNQAELFSRLGIVPKR